MNITPFNFITNSRPYNKAAVKLQNNKITTFPLKPKRKTLACLVGLSILFGSLTSCFSRNKINSEEIINNINIEYTGVNPETADAVKDAISDFAEKNDIDFLENVNLTVVDEYKNLNTTNSFQQYMKQSENRDNEKGCSFYSDSRLPKNILIQESAHNADKIMNILSGNELSNYKFIRQTLLHEIGHQFDSYYGHDHNDEFAKVWDEIQYQREKNPQLSPYTTPKDNKSIIAKINYNSENGLSDKPEFKQAILKDLNKIAKLRESNQLASNIDYYISDIDFSTELNEDDIDLYDGVRAEVYANLFSYAIGEDDNNKAKFVNNFINSFKVVQKDIKKYISK